MLPVLIFDDAGIGSTKSLLIVGLHDDGDIIVFTGFESGS
jgi:hypothetical protein